MPGCLLPLPSLQSNTAATVTSTVTLDNMESHQASPEVWVVCGAPLGWHPALPTLSPQNLPSEGFSGRRRNQKPDCQGGLEGRGKQRGYWVNFLSTRYLVLSSFHGWPKRVFSFYKHVAFFEVWNKIVKTSQSCLANQPAADRVLWSTFPSTCRFWLLLLCVLAWAFHFAVEAPRRGC